MDVIVEKLRRRPVLLYNQALSKQLKEDETGLSQCNVTLTEISLKQNRGAYLNEGFNLSLDYVSTQMTEGSADRSWYSDVRKTFLFLRLTAPLRSRVRVHVFHKCLEILKTKKQMLIRQSKQKVNIACLTYQPLPAEKATTRQNYRSNTLYANALRNFNQLAKLFTVHSLWC